MEERTSPQWADFPWAKWKPCIQHELIYFKVWISGSPEKIVLLTQPHLIEGHLILVYLILCLPRPTHPLLPFGHLNFDLLTLNFMMQKILTECYLWTKSRGKSHTQYTFVWSPSLCTYPNMALEWFWGAVPWHLHSKFGNMDFRKESLVSSQIQTSHQKKHSWHSATTHWCKLSVSLAPFSLVRLCSKFRSIIISTTATPRVSAGHTPFEYWMNITEYGSALPSPPRCTSYL